MAVVELLSLFSILFIVFLLLRPLSASKSQTLLPPSPFALPIIGHFHLLGPLIHQSFYKLSLQFGPLFYLRLGSVPCIVISSPDLAKESLKTHELSFISRSQFIAIERLTYSSSLAFGPYGPYHKFIKKLSLNEFLSSRSVSNFASIRTQEYVRLLRLLAKKAESGEAVNLTEELPKLSNNVIAKMMLGNSKGSSNADGRDEEARLVVREVTRIFGEFNLSDFVWFCKKLDLQGFGKRIEDTHRRFDTLVEKVISEREELRKKNTKNEGGNGGEEVKDFLDILLDILEKGSAECEEVEFTRVHIKALIMDFFTAGTDTTAISMEWALAELINHPKVLEKAREEIDRVAGNRRLVVESDGPNLPYVQAIIKETLRLHPSVPMIPRKSVQKCNIGNYVIPENTMLFVNAWAIGRDPKYWENPLHFYPERFLAPLSGGGDGASALDVRGQHFQLLPFGTGRRICPGLNLALQMLPALLGAMVQCFDWKVVVANQKHTNGDERVLEMDERPGMTTPRAHDLICIPVARFDPELYP
ncbi:licodione synthase-like [Pyrus ussuriensis x Pyrus communis]|uniref:Licodione synthase-like n=1 Tax=Pyrus ussuriensis x Pyrus communis TaxID=2448454 RepID=A0A5N5FUP7_9ROSA|nr:licodione synthase-like [Pyrus ussuriensis x Pyrus communis]